MNQVNDAAKALTVMYPLFQTGEGGSTPTLPLSAKSLRLDTIPAELAKPLNRLWHSKLPRIGTGCVQKTDLICYGAHYGGRIFAVAIWSKPVARKLPQRTWLELRRLATSPQAPKNTCTRMLRVMELLVREKLPRIERLVSYQDTECHTGAIYKAAGWTSQPVSRFTEWHRKSRPRPPSQSKADKVRWEKILGGATTHPLETITDDRDDERA